VYLVLLLRKSDDGREITFQTRGSGIGAGAWVGIVFMGVFFGFLIALIMESFVALFVLIALCVGIAFLMSTSRSQEYTFSVTPDLIKAGGKEYAKSDVSEILIRNSSGNTAGQAQVEGGTVVFGTGVTGMAYAGATTLGNSAKKIGDSTGKAIQESMAKRGNALCIRHGRKVVPLAKNMQEDDAVALFNKVTEVV
jgi:uncharacterized membrane protein